MKKVSIFFLILVFFSSCHSQRKYEKSDFYYVKVDDRKNQGVTHHNVKKNYLTSKKKVKKELIVVDAGHGGEDMGTRSLIPPKYQEKSLNLATAFFLKEFLEKMGYEVEMTRGDDTFIPLPSRSLFANEAKSKLFVSVHYNAAESKLADGIEVYYYKSEKDKLRSDHSKKLADLVLEQVIAKTGAKSRGVKHGNLSVVRETNMPAILVEGGFMTNEKEMEKIKDPSYIKKIAFGIALGVDRYLKSNPL